MGGTEHHQRLPLSIMYTQTLKLELQTISYHLTKAHNLFILTL